MKTNDYKNRYGSIFTFNENDNHDILWEGNFEYCRIGIPNDYTKAYNSYVADGNKLSFNEFKDIVHKYDDVKKEYILGDKYVRMVESLKNKIEMIDPSGGPYISKGMKLDNFGFKDYVVKDFKRIKSGYKIITEKCFYCNLAGAIHKLGCSAKKVTVYFDQMEKEVHKSNSNLNN